MEIRPQPGPQEAFLSTPADVAIYGGAAGGGKTFALLLEPLRHIANPDFGAVIFRRTSPQITNEGGLWDESMRLYPLAGGSPLAGTMDWRFPRGSNIGFRHLQYEQTKLDWQGAQVAMFGFDELTHFTEGQFFYLFSRNRSTSGVRPYIRGGCNPDGGSWVKRFLAPWVDRKYPHPARSGELRWMVRVNGEIAWVPEGTPDARSVTFVRASVYDNRILLAKDPGYLSNLKALPRVDQARLLHGDWDVKREGLVYPDFDRTRCEPAEVRSDGTPVGGLDFGWNNPFGGIHAYLDHDDVLWCDRIRYGSKVSLSGHSKWMPRDGCKWWADPAGADQIAELRIAGHHVVPCVHLGRTPMKSGIAAVTDRIATGRLRVSSDCAMLFEEAGLYRYDEAKLTEDPIDADNHLMSALRYLIVGLDRGRAVDDPQPDGEGAAAAEAERQQADRSAEHASAENPHWWPDED